VIRNLFNRGTDRDGRGTKSRDENSTQSPNSGNSEGARNSSKNNALANGETAKEIEGRELGENGIKIAHSGKGGNGKPPIIWDKFWPACILIDEAYTAAQGNAVIQNLTERANECHVNFLPFPVTISNNINTHSRKPDEINRLARTACNLTELYGFPKVSVQTVVKNRVSAAEMCDSYKYPKDKNGKLIKIPNEKVAGCAELSKNPKWTPVQFKKYQAQIDQSSNDHGKLSWAKDENILASIVVEQGVEGNSAVTVPAHEMFGHNVMGQPNGKTLGMHIGKYGEKPGDPQGPSHRFSAEGCKIFESNSLDNSVEQVAFYPGKPDYYTDKNKQRVFNLLSNRSAFEQGSALASTGGVITPSSAQALPVASKKSNPENSFIHKVLPLLENSQNNFLKGISKLFKASGGNSPSQPKLYDKEKFFGGSGNPEGGSKIVMDSDADLELNTEADLQGAKGQERFQNSVASGQWSKSSDPNVYSQRSNQSLESGPSREPAQKDTAFFFGGVEGKEMDPDYFKKIKEKQKERSTTPRPSVRRDR